MSINTQNIINTLSVNDTEQDVKRKLIEKILENMRSQLEYAPSEGKAVSIVSDAKKKIQSIVGDDDQNPTYIQLLGSLDALIQRNQDASSLNEKNGAKPAASPRSMTHRMTAALSSHAELKQPANANLHAADRSNRVGASSPSDSGGYIIPAPALPPSGCPDYDDLSNSDINNWILSATDQSIETALMNYYQYLMGPGKTDPTGMMKLMNFIAYLTTHTRPDGSPLIDQKISDFLTNNCALIRSDGKDGGIALWVRQMADYAFAAGYKGLTGHAARDAWIADEKAAWNQFPSNKWQQEVLNCLDTKDITNDPNLQELDTPLIHTIIYIYDGITYYWDDTGSATCPFSDRDIIMSIFNGQTTMNKDGTVTPDGFYDDVNLAAMEKNYRIETLNQLLKQFKDPIWAVLLFFTQSTDSQFQSQMSAHSRESDDVSDWQVYAATLNQEIQKFQTGTATADDAKSFVRALYGAKIFIDQHPSLAGLRDSFTANVYNMIKGLKVNSKTLPTLGDLIQFCTRTNDYKTLAGEMVDVFQSSNPGTTPNGNTQTAVTAANTFTTEVTGESKNEVTIQAQDASTESAFTKLGESINQLQSQLGKAFCNNQKTA